MEGLRAVSYPIVDEAALSSTTIHPSPEKKQSPSPPFSTGASICMPSAHIHPAGVNFQYKLIKPHEDLYAYLEVDLTTPKLNRIHRFLWLAGLPRPARPLHRQKLMNRSITLTESPDEHLVWHQGQIFIKPIPEYLLDHGFWMKELCPHLNLHSSACGLLLSYAWLISSKSDFQIAKDERILSPEVTWTAWVSFVRDFLEWTGDTGLGPYPITCVNERYQYGELRLTRLNSLYKFTPSTFSVRNFIFGFMSSSTWYRAFFERNFSWIFAALVYVSVLLSAMQVGLATSELTENYNFQRFCYGFALASIISTLILVGMIAVFWASLFCYHLCLTIVYHRRVQREREG
ncbi:hypothetical protein BDV27DRAFT_34159 [Aspergillus caelatus]|uniref:Uncharacterized protein n=1 Tax=Aspergillus caelatus TaxID=61420 RepID=A0A5N6ZU14_9EURO|nr:uncharacterized protein BDV27DRAFT_34159 [Aspergillus caelatus]KAE8360895.1 hypothetical protein BDV27DRAFT_34159 [Aspergillus caelatus]